MTDIAKARETAWAIFTNGKGGVYSNERKSFDRALDAYTPLLLDAMIKSAEEELNATYEADKAKPWRERYKDMHRFFADTWLKSFREAQSP